MDANCRGHAFRCLIVKLSYKGRLSRPWEGELSDPELIGLPRFFERWHHPDTQLALQALVARLRK